MKLRTGQPLWLSPHVLPLRHARLSRTHRCDVAIIGAGITGALVAHQLLAAGLSVAMLDKRQAGFGSTVASTGLLLYQPDSSIGDLIRRHDHPTAKRVYELGRKAVQELGALSRRLHLDCGWGAKRTLYLGSDAEGAALLKQEAKRTARLGFAVELLSADVLRARHQLEFPAALAAAGSAQVNAFRLTRGVLQHAQREPRFRLFQNTRVTSLRENRETITLRTHTGSRVVSRHVIVAAGYESRRFVRSRLIRLASTYVIASKPFPPARLRPVRDLMWETARPYFYLRTSADHRIIFGGQDEPFDTDSSRMKKLNRKTRLLEEQFAALFPDLAFKADYAWSGAFADTVDGLPCIGPKRAGSRVLYALGYGGNGITFSQIAARILCDACRGRFNADAALFAFDRAPRKRGRSRRKKEREKEESGERRKRRKKK